MRVDPGEAVAFGINQPGIGGIRPAALDRRGTLSDWAAATAAAGRVLGGAGP